MKNQIKTEDYAPLSLMPHESADALLEIHKCAEAAIAPYIEDITGKPTIATLHKLTVAVNRYRMLLDLEPLKPSKHP